MHLPFYFVDVFAERPLTGNPLSIVPDAHSLDETTMKLIASELNQAETTFISPSEIADWRLRSFTAGGHEVFGAGHNSLGAWWWLAEAGRLDLSERDNSFTQEIGGQVLPVVLQCDEGRTSAVILTQSPPQWGNTLRETAELAFALGIDEQDLELERVPPQVVSTGAGHLLVLVRDRTVVDKLQPDAPRLAEVLRKVGGEGCYVFSLDPISPGSAAYARFFNPTVGIVEDAATGTAAGPLASLLVRYGVATEGETISVEQGFKMKRPSILRLQVNGEVVKLIGKGISVIEGKIRVL